MMRLAARLQTWTDAYPKESYVLILASLVNAVGSAMLWPLTTLYVHNVLHRSYGEAGFVLFCQAFAAVLGQFWGGALFHRLGAKRLIVGSLLLAGVAQFGLLFTKAWTLYIAMMTINGLLNAMTMPAVNAFIGFRFAQERYRLFNAVYVCNNIGVAIGTSLAGLLALVSYNLTFFIDGLSTVSFGVFFLFYLQRVTFTHGDEPTLGAGLRSGEAGPWALFRDYRIYLFGAVGTMLISVATSAWNTGIAPFLNQQGMDPAQYSLLWTVNGIVILIGQPLIRVLNQFITKSLYMRLVGSAVFYLLGFTFMFVLHSHYVYLMVSMVVCTFGEMLIAPANPALITQTTGRSAPFYLGVVGGFGNLGKLVGPPLFGTLFDLSGVVPILAIAAAMAGIATLAFLVHNTLRARPRIGDTPNVSRGM